MNPRSPLPLPRLAALLAALLAAPLAQAGYVQAVAEEGTYPAVFNQNAGVLATAASPNNQPGGDAASRATRLRVSASSEGSGAGTTGQYFHAASAANYSTYTLWDLDANAAMAEIDARRLNLFFNFRMLSWLQVPVGGAGLDIGTLQYRAEVVSTQSATINSSFDSVSYAVGTPDSWTGNLGLLGSSDLSFSVMHDDSLTGWLEMSFGNSSANDVSAAGFLALVSVDVTEDAPAFAASSPLSSDAFIGFAAAVPLSGRNLGVKFDSGDVYAFGQSLVDPGDPGGNPVPEPSGLLLALTGLALLRLRR